MDSYAGGSAAFGSSEAYTVSGEITVDKMVTAAITPERIRLNRYLLFMFSTSFLFFFISHKNSRMFPPGLSVLVILLSCVLCPSWLLQTGIGAFVIPPCFIAVQVSKQMLPHIFVFVPD